LQKKEEEKARAVVHSKIKIVGQPQETRFAKLTAYVIPQQYANWMSEKRRSSCYTDSAFDIFDNYYAYPKPLLMETEDEVGRKRYVWPERMNTSPKQ
jgi:hypothetical protein